MKEYFARRV